MNLTKFILGWGMVLCYVLLNSTGALLIKNKIVQVGAFNFESFGATFRYFFHLLTSFQVLAGFSAIFLSALAWMIALSRMELSIAYPVAVGFNFLVIIAMSMFLFGETLSTEKIIGITLILAGVYFIASI